MWMVFSRNFSPDLEDIILRNLPCFVYCPTFFPQSTMNGSRYLPSSMSVLHLTRSIMLSYSVNCLFCSGSRDQHVTGCVFIVGRTQTVHYCGSVSQCAVVHSGVAQGSVLGPLLYVLYTADIQKLVESLGFGVHLYTDDTQFHGSCSVSEGAGLAGRAMRVVNDIKYWMSSNRLRLNADKTQFIWLSKGHFLGKRDMQAIDTILSSTDVVNNLGVYLDSGLTLERQVSKLCQVCYFHLRRRTLRTVRRSLSKECLRTLVHAFVSSRVDHCNGFLYWSYSYPLDRLQSVLNSAARLILNIAKFSGISAAIRDELHWLPIRKRIEFKIVLLVRHCLIGAAPEYLMELCRPVSSRAGRQSLRSASRGDLIIPRFRLRTFGFRAFAISGPQPWNSLPLDVRQSRDNLMQFKKKLKTFLFQQFWALRLWIQSNEEPYKGSILLLLLPVRDVLMILSYKFLKFSHYSCFRGQGIHRWYFYRATMFGWPRKSR